MKSNSIIRRSAVAFVALTWATGVTPTRAAYITYQDLTPGVSASTYTFDGQLSGAGSITNVNFIGGQWITDSANPHWAQYSLGSLKNAAYALVGGNLGRVPDFVKVQYTTAASPGPLSTWTDIGSVTPQAGGGMTYVPLDVAATAVRVYMEKTSAPNAHTDLEAFRVYGTSNPGDVGWFNTAPLILGSATLQLVNTWENNLGATPVMTHWTNTVVPTSSGSLLRANGDLASKPEAILTWATDQLVSGVALANIDWSTGNSGSIYAMHVDVLPMGLDPLLATPGDWSTVATYDRTADVVGDDTSFPNTLIHLSFTSLQTRGLRLVVTDVEASSFGSSRSGGDISEFIVLGGGNIPEPSTALLFVSGAGLLWRWRRRK